MYKLKVVVIVLLALLVTINAIEDPIVQLPKGKIRGHILKSEKGKPYYAFQEVPYAAPPLGKNKFQLAKEPEPWSGILNTTKNTVICYQESSDYKNLALSEDCLYLNVYTPVVPGTQERLPVALWFHGGHFSRHGGTYEFNGPQYLMDHGIVVVTCNFRQGPYGFLTTDDDVIPANIGLKDQIFIMKWVQENIHLFGGNKFLVTIAGESSGGMAVSYHLSGPWTNNKVLYHGAIIESGSTLFFGRDRNYIEEAFKVGQRLNSKFSSKDSKELLEVLQKASSADIWKAAKDIDYGPIKEKNGPFSYSTYESFAAGNFKKIPVYFGFNSEESIIGVKNLDDVKKSAAEFDKNPSLLLGKNYNISDVNRALAGNLLKKIYTNTSFAENLGAFIRYSSDDMTTTPSTKEVTLISKYAPVYLYQFAYKGKLGRNFNTPYIPGCERVGHAEDLDYIWDDQSNSDLSKFSPEDGLMLHRFVKMWTNFVKYHNPTPEKDELLQNLSWPKVDPKNLDNIHYMNMNKTLEILSNPRYYQRVIKVYDKYVSPTDIN